MTIMEKPTGKASRGGGVGEFITEARLDALNRALAAHGVDPSEIISIFQLPAQSIANAVPARFQVLYRKG
jgi:hypothetical protein